MEIVWNEYEICNKWNCFFKMLVFVISMLCLIRWLRFFVDDFRGISLIGVDNRDYLLRKCKLLNNLKLYNNILNLKVLYF